MYTYYTVRGRSFGTPVTMLLTNEFGKREVGSIDMSRYI